MEPSTFRDHVRGMLRDRLIDAAVARAATEQWERVRMADVAEDAGVSRQTVYNEFGTKASLAEALVTREVGRVLLEIKTTLDRESEFEAAIEAAVEHALTAAENHPVLTRVLDDARRGEGHTLLPLLTTRADALLTPARLLVIAHVRERWPSIAGPWLDPAADALIRLVISHIVLASESRLTVAADLSQLVHLFLVASAGEEGK